MTPLSLSMPRPDCRKLSLGDSMISQISNDYALGLALSLKNTAAWEYSSIRAKDCSIARTIRVST